MAHPDWLIVGAAVLLWLVGMGYGIATLAGKKIWRVRKSLWCVPKGKDAEVELIVREGEPTDVSRCSIFGDNDPTCEKTCLRAG
jgi:hypothetical protein